jgi:hypothetical protein
MYPVVAGVAAKEVLKTVRFTKPRLEIAKHIDGREMVANC